MRPGRGGMAGCFPGAGGLRVRLPMTRHLAGWAADYRDPQQGRQSMLGGEQQGAAGGRSRRARRGARPPGAGGEGAPSLVQEGASPAEALALRRAAAAQAAAAAKSTRHGAGFLAQEVCLWHALVSRRGPWHRGKGDATSSCSVAAWGMACQPQDCCHPRSHTPPDVFSFTDLELILGISRPGMNTQLSDRATTCERIAP